MAVAKPNLEAKLTCPCGGGFEMNGPQDVVEKHMASWRREHKPHPTSPSVVPSGATSGVISLQLGHTYSDRMEARA